MFVVTVCLCHGGVLGRGMNDVLLPLLRVYVSVMMASRTRHYYGRGGMTDGDFQTPSRMCFGGWLATLMGNTQSWMYLQG